MRLTKEAKEAAERFFSFWRPKVVTQSANGHAEIEFELARKLMPISIEKNGDPYGLEYRIVAGDGMKLALFRDILSGSWFVNAEFGAVRNLVSDGDGVLAYYERQLNARRDK